MNNTFEIDRFIKDPKLFADLCRELVVRLDVMVPDGQNESESSAMESQLREIAKTIDRLEKLNVAVPDVLRAEKTRLAAALSIHDESAAALEALADTLMTVVREIRARLQSLKPPAGAKVISAAGLNQDRLPRSALRESIVKCLQSFGGRASNKDVLKMMEADLQGQFKPADLVWLESEKSYSWRASASKERANMIRDGILRSGSPIGIWELDESRS